MRIWLHLKFGNTFQHFCLQFFWNSRSNVSCYGIISAFKRIVFCWWQTPFDAFVCVIIRASCKRQHPNAAVISNAIIVIKTLLFYNDLSNWISHAECTIYTRYRHMTFYLFIYLLRCILTFKVKICERNNNTIKAELFSRPNSDLKFLGTGLEGLNLYLVILQKGVWIFNVNINIISLVLKHQLH